MLNREHYLQLLKNKDYINIVSSFRNDFIILLKEMLDYKNIEYKEIDLIDYYIALCRKNYHFLDTALLMVNNIFTDAELDSIEKVDCLLNLYGSILKQYKRNDF